MVYVLLIFLIIIIIQNFYIRYLKKEICLRDGTYQPKKRKRLFHKPKESMTECSPTLPEQEEFHRLSFLIL